MRISPTHFLWNFNSNSNQHSNRPVVTALISKRLVPLHIKRHIPAKRERESHNSRNTDFYHLSRRKIFLSCQLYNSPFLSKRQPGKVLSHKVPNCATTKVSKKTGVKIRAGLGPNVTPKNPNTFVQLQPLFSPSTCSQHRTIIKI